MRYGKQKNPKHAAPFVCALLFACGSVALQGQSCTTQAEMSSPTRSALIAASQKVSQSLLAADSKTMQEEIAPQVAAEAAGILSAMSEAATKVKGAAFTVDNLYVLDATGMKPDETAARFYCGVFNRPEHVVLSLGALPQGQYALALIHATGILNPQQIAAIFEDAKGQWKLAGFSFRPLTMDGHNSLWYWQQARAYVAKHETWNAYFYYTTARYLATPAAYLSSTNLDTLLQEQQSAQPAGLPGAQPMQLTANGQNFPITKMETSDALGGLDLVIHYNVADIKNLTEIRRQNTAVMQAMLLTHPELKNAFHGMWVYAEAAGQSPFGIELPMTQIP